jgi:tight adherence protein C
VEISMPEIAIAVAAFLAVTGAGLIASWGFDSQQARIARQLSRITDKAVRNNGAGWIGQISVALGRRLLRRSRELQDLARHTQAAGYFSASAPYHFVGIQLGSAALLATIAAAVAMAAGHRAPTPILGAVAGVSCGYLGPRFLLRALAARRRRNIRREMPFFIDMLLLLVRSGAGVDRCFREIAFLARDAIPAIHRTVVLLINDLDQGRSYHESLERWADRMSEPAAQEIARQFRQAMTVGTEISRILGQFSQRLITRSLLSAREKAGRRSTHVTITTLVCFMPALLIVLAAPGFAHVIRIMTGH